MSCTGEVGISPVLLQVISHTLTSSEVGSENCLNNNSLEKHRENNGFRLHECKTKDVKPNILHINSNQNPENKILPLLHGLHQPTESLISQVQVDSNDLTENVTDTPPDLKAMLKLKLDQESKANSNPVIFSQNDPNVVNIFTAINNNENRSKNFVFELKKCSGHEEVIVCFNRDSSTAPSPENGGIVSDSDSGIGDASKKRHLTSSDRDYLSSPQKLTRLEDEIGHNNEENSDSTSQSATNIQTIYIHPEEIMPLKIPVSSVTNNNNNSSSKDAMDKENCPICSDKVSGYHYGIFSCESCKGFFKRTVQNKKVYQCHQKSCCEINVYNRKKCPACRFNKCLESGMLLEAIRLDRTRGGRSSYDGCSPHGRIRDVVDKQKVHKLTTVKPNNHQQHQQQQQQQQQQHSKRSVTIPNMTIQKVNQNKASQLVAILSRNSSSDDKKPFVPQILTDIMNLESLLCDDEPNSQILLEDSTSYTSLLQITEDRLYKIVRWARNLSQFTSISTDDQILLLQNCWSDLLLLECCYRSKEKPSEIRLAQGATLLVKTAKSLGMGSVVSMVVELAEQLNRLKVDLYEFVGLKVLVLITPDVKGLKHPEKIREHQEKLCEALDMYTGSHYPQHPNKFGEMILTLPILSRISIKGKELITDSQLNDISTYGLLYELLKGENASKESQNTPENT
ncbi:nuclear hormone receptor FTZ-F1 beta-like [Argonauta hians]